MRAILRWLRNEPMLYFVLLGAAIFAARPRLAQTDRRDRIAVTRGRIESLATGFTLTWKRPPTASELEELIQDYIREEIYVREAIALRLDHDDTIIRRRLRQKLEFVSEDLIARAEPTTEQLRAWFDAHAEKFRTAQTITFDHVYLNRQRRAERLADDLESLREALRHAGESPDLSRLGDPFLLETSFDRVAVSEARELFGDAFARAVAQLPLGEWSGPVESGYGVHLVRVRGRSGGLPGTFEDVRETVRREWLEEQRAASNAKFYDAQRKRYEVTVEQLYDGAPAPATARR